MIEKIISDDYISYGYKLLAQSNPITRFIVGHASYDVSKCTPSDSYFSAKKMHECTVPDGESPHTLLVGNPEKHLFYLNEILTWSDGEHSLIDIANKLNVSIFEIQSAVTILLKRKLIKIYKKY